MKVNHHTSNNGYAKNTNPINSIIPVCVNYLLQPLRPTDHKREVNQDLGESLSNQSVGWSEWYSTEVWSAISFILAQTSSMEKSLQWRAVSSQVICHIQISG